MILRLCRHNRRKNPIEPQNSLDPQVILPHSLEEITEWLRSELLKGFAQLSYEIATNATIGEEFEDISLASVEESRLKSWKENVNKCITMQMNSVKDLMKSLSLEMIKEFPDFYLNI